MIVYLFSAGTKIYKAPELFVAAGYDEAVDVCASGVLLLQMLLYRRHGYQKAMDLENALDQLILDHQAGNNRTWPFLGE